MESSGILLFQFSVSVWSDTRIEKVRLERFDWKKSIRNSEAITNCRLEKNASELAMISEMVSIFLGIVANRLFGHLLLAYFSRLVSCK